LSTPAPEPSASTPKLYRGLKRALDRPGADRAVVVLALILLCFSLDTGLSADDYVHQLIARGSHELPGFVRPPLDLYRFADASTMPELIHEGIMSWWEDPEAQLAFMRPLSALTHILDYRWFPEQPWLMHLHSVLWSALLFAGLLVLYRALLPSSFLPALALFVYAFDDARGWLTSWIAGRNAVIATALSVWALVFHQRWRARGDKLSAWLAPLLLLLSLLAGEGAAAILGYFLAHALCLEQGSWRARARSLLPALVVVVPWRIAWRALGYGVAHSGLYFDPLATPIDFLTVFVERGPILLFSQIGGVWSDIWSLIFAYPWLQRTLLLAAIATLLAYGYALWPLLRRDPTLRFAVLGALIAVIPASAAFLADRLLTWVAIGGSIATAKLILAYGEEPETLRAEPLRALLIAPLMLGLLFAKTVIEPIFMPSRARGNLVLRDNLDRAQAGVPSDPSIASKVVVYVNPPGVPLAAYIPVERAAQGIPRPISQLYLATGEADIRVTRIDASSVRVRQRGGFLQSPGSHLFRDPRRPTPLGHRVELNGASIEVSAQMPDGRPAEILARFATPLDDPGWLWLQWRARGYEPFPIPAIGESRVLPALDLADVLIGDLVRLPFDGRLVPAQDPGWTQP
jgi:hypothetical protein